MEKDIKFDKRADKYDGGFEGRFSRKFYDRLIDEVNAFGGAYVLDVGCGTGTILRRLADKCKINGFGIDVEAKMIEQAKEKCPEMDIRVSVCESTPFDVGTFDIVVTCMAYHHFADKRGFAKETAKIMKKGGVMYIADVRFIPPFRAAVNAVLKLGNIAGRFCTPDEIYENFSEFGFKPAGYSKKGFVQIVKLER